VDTTAAGRDERLGLVESRAPAKTDAGSASGAAPPGSHGGADGQEGP
jgi:hypothetical protein